VGSVSSCLRRDEVDAEIKLAQGEQVQISAGSVVFISGNANI